MQKQPETQGWARRLSKLIIIQRQLEIDKSSYNNHGVKAILGKSTCSDIQIPKEISTRESTGVWGTYSCLLRNLHNSVLTLNKVLPILRAFTFQD